MSVTRFIATKLIATPSDGKMSKRSNTIATASVCISFMVMILALSIVGGFKSEIRGKINGFMGSAILGMPGQGPINEQYPFSESLSYLHRIEEINGVSSISGVAYRSGLVKTTDNIEGLCFKGVKDKEIGMNDIVISTTTAARLGLERGDKMTVYFIGEQVKVRRFTVADFFNAQLNELDSKFAMVNIAQIQRVNGWKDDEVSCIELRYSEKADQQIINQQIEDIEAYFSDENDQSLMLTPVKRMYSHLFDWLSLLDFNVLMVLVLMIIVAGFNMISALLIILFEKISMIGLLKSLGMTSGSIERIFLLQASSIVGKGLVLGNLLGISLSLVEKYTKIIKLDPENYFVSAVPIKLDFLQIVLLDIGAFALIMLIISLSSRLVARIRPEKTLKVE